MKAWHEAHPGKRKEYNSKWAKSNPENTRKVNRRKQSKYYNSHPEFRAKAVARAAKWQKENPERSRELRIGVGHRRRARKYATQIGPINYKEVVAVSNGLCGICNGPVTDKFEYDHIIPLARDGAHTQDNLQVAHPDCNHRKNSRLQEELVA